MTDTSPLVRADSVTFRLADAGRAAPALDGTRLLPALSLPAADGLWRLPVRRMEYRFELRHPAGGTEEICDPAT
ncbi:hypothetical protein [Actinophytocola sp.]|uniref:hypothetical protein n=1 Tax=Actinophytocola sp. TaxID=1872138 RepID=UPI003D6BD896